MAGHSPPEDHLNQSSSCGKDGQGSRKQLTFPPVSAGNKYGKTGPQGTKAEKTEDGQGSTEPLSFPHVSAGKRYGKTGQSRKEPVEEFEVIVDVENDTSTLTRKRQMLSGGSPHKITLVYSNRCLERVVNKFKQETDHKTLIKKHHVPYLEKNAADYFILCLAIETNFKNQLQKTVIISGDRGFQAISSFFERNIYVVNPHDNSYKEGQKNILECVKTIDPLYNPSVPWGEIDDLLKEDFSEVKFIIQCENTLHVDIRNIKVTFRRNELITYFKDHVVFFIVSFVKFIDMKKACRNMIEFKIESALEWTGRYEEVESRSALKYVHTQIKP